MKAKLLAALALVLATFAAHAGPMGYKDSWMAMGDFGPDWRESWLNYGFTARDAVGAGVVWMRSDDGRLRRTFVETTYTRLLQRWNMPNSQANVWLVAGAGAVSGNDFDGQRFMFAPGIQADYETTRVYIAGGARAYRANDINHDLGWARAGFSFYEVDYDQVQPWLIVEVRRMRELSDSLEVTPMLRLIHSRYFVELGMSTDGRARANFMLLF